MARVVKIDDKEYSYSFDYGAILAYEQLAGKFDPTASKSLTNAVVHYSCLVADNNFTMSLAEFVSKLQTKEVVEQLNEAHRVEYARWSGEQPMRGIEDTGEASKAEKSKKK